MDPSYAEYLKLLSERNKLIRSVRKGQHSTLEEREQGFNLYIAGANDHRTRQQGGTEKAGAGGRRGWDGASRRSQHPMTQPSPRSTFGFDIHHSAETCWSSETMGY